jgi:phospholipid/cholesterol/gamma-HCH transport system substrate-binding protein
VRWLSRFVSILVIAAVIVAFGMFIRSRMPDTHVGESFKTCASFRDGSKLATGSPVMIAGVRVGEVSGLSIQGEYARVDMVLTNGVEIPNDSWVTKRAYSPFGDSYIEIVPSGEEVGAPTGQMLRSGQCLMRVAEGSSTDRLLRVVARTMPKIDTGLERVSEVTTFGRKWAVGTLEDKILDADKWLQEEHVEAPLHKADDALANIESATTKAASAVHDAAPGINRTFDRLENGVVTARKRMAEVTVDMRSGFQRARDGMNGVDQTIDDINEVVGAVNEGRGSGAQGAIGRMINDPQLANDLEEATDSAREGTSQFSRFKSWLGLRTEYNIFSAKPRFFVTAEIRARTDKFYLVEFERGPLGDFPDDTIRDTPGIPAYTRNHVIKDGIRFTAQFGKTFGNWFQIRGGLKESTFGFGSDILLGQGRLKLSADLYGSVFRNPRLKLAGALAVFRGIYFNAGVDDALNDKRYLPIRAGNSEVPNLFDKVRYGRDYFLGATLHFTDADLSTLIRVYGALLVGLL